MIQELLARSVAAASALSLILVASSAAFSQATIVIQNNDPENVGFNDPTPAAPVGGNMGATVGQQRLNAFQFAASIWGATLTSGPTITVAATWEALTCSANSGTLGSAGTLGIFSDFPGAPLANTWYSAALANARAGFDLDPGSAEIRARFNVNIGMPGCFENAQWYYGLDNNPPANGIDLVPVLLHEFAHGLGFQTFTNRENGMQPQNRPSIYDRFLFDATVAKTWAEMSDAERQASAINTGNLVWNGSQVLNDVQSVLGTPRLRVNQPAAIAGNYQVGTADFGSPLPSAGLTASIVQALDPSDGAGPSTTDGCSPLTNAAEVRGKIALIDRGTCLFVTKVKNAQDAGAIAVVIADNQPGSPPPGLGGSDPAIVIPSVRITQADGNTIKAQLAVGVNATLLLDHTTPIGADSSNRPLMFTPNPLQGGSSVSHWDSSAFPDQLMEPMLSDTLTHSVRSPQDLTHSLFQDIGWQSIDSWVPAELSASEVDFRNWTIDGVTSVYVKLTFPHAGFRVMDFGTPSQSGNSFSVNAQVEMFTGPSLQAQTNTAAIYELGMIPAGSYQFNFLSSGVLVDSHTFEVSLSAPPPNPIDSSTNPPEGTRQYVRNHYLDFLGREPDGPGWDFWTDNIEKCRDDARRPAGQTIEQCLDKQRETTSGAFFLSNEFQFTGYYMYRVYRGSLGRQPKFSEFVQDSQFLGDGIVVNNQLSPEKIEENKRNYALAFVNRAEFKAIYDGLDNAAYVNKLFETTGINATMADRQALVDSLNSGMSDRAAVMQKVVDGIFMVTPGEFEFRTPYGEDYYLKEFNAAFVLMQYFGYLRRDPDEGGFNHWKGKLDFFSPMVMGHYGEYVTGRFGEYINAEMVRSFIVSHEYRSRFGAP